MNLIIGFLKAFLVGGAICAIGELLVLKTKLTPARILVGYIVAGVILSAVGLYGPVADFAGAGASIPLTGFGHALTTGVRRAVQECLTEREADIIRRRYGLDGFTPQTQRQVAAHYGISRSYVSRLEKRALEKLEQAIGEI